MKLALAALVAALSLNLAAPATASVRGAATKPDSLSFQYWPLPDQRFVVTNVVLSTDGTLWLDTMARVKCSQSQICELQEFGHVVNGQITLYQAPAPGTYDWISAGPNGTLWIVSGTNLLVYSAAGVLTATFPVSSTTGDLRPPVLGADGRMWLADFTNRVLAVDASGNVSSYKCANICGGMVAGRNNELWGTGLTSDYAEFFYSVTTAGVVTEYGNPGGYLVAGPGQALESVDGAQINAIDANENVIPFASLKPLGLDQAIAVSASNSELWFVGTRDNERKGVVGTVSSKGAMRSQSFAKAPCREAYVYFSALTQGSDGAMYGGFGCGDSTGTHAGFLARITPRG